MKKFSYMTSKKSNEFKTSVPKKKTVLQPRTFASEPGLTSGFSRNSSNFEHNHGAPPKIPTGQNYSKKVK